MAGRDEPTTHGGRGAAHRIRVAGHAGKTLHDFSTIPPRVKLPGKSYIEAAGDDAASRPRPRTGGDLSTIPSGYALRMPSEVVVRLARPGDARAIAEVSVASRRWSYRDLLGEADLDALSVAETDADFAQGLDELPAGAAVFVAERAARVVRYAYVLPSPDDDVPAGTSELGSIYVTEDVAGTGIAQAL
jgi:hypothetical protein